MRDGVSGRVAGRFHTDRRGAEAFVVPPFARMARAHAFAIAGDTLVTVALADSLFFSIDPSDARWRVALYLLLTMAPFAVVAPWLGPLMDRLRGGHRAMIIATAVTRAGIALLIARHIDGLALFPLAFAMLVLGKTYAIARSALVPSLVPNEAALVGANSRLSLLSAVAGAAAAIPGAALLWLAGSSWVLAVTAVVFLVAGGLALKIPGVRVAEERADAEERAELRQAGILLAATGMGYLRGVVGFLAMLLAFNLRGRVDPGPTGDGVELGHRIRETMGLPRLDLTTGGAPAWHFGVVLVGVGLGGFAGAAIAPRLRAMAREEKILVGVLTATAALALLSAIAGGLIGSFLAAFAVATAAAAGKQAFDAIVQRDAPEANLGRSFSRFETRFQLIWVLGALIPVVLPIPARVGFLGVALTAAFAAFTVHYGRSPLTRIQHRLDPAAVAVRRRLEPLRSRARQRPGLDRFRRPGRRDDGTVPSPGAHSTSAPDGGAEPAVDGDDAADAAGRLDGTADPDETRQLDATDWPGPTVDLDETGQRDGRGRPGPTAESDRTGQRDETSEPDQTGEPDRTDERGETAEPDHTGDPDRTGDGGETGEPDRTGDRDRNCQAEATGDFDQTKELDPASVVVERAPDPDPADSAGQPGGLDRTRQLHLPLELDRTDDLDHRSGRS